jgi:hypothetical protein
MDITAKGNVMVIFEKFYGRIGSFIDSDTGICANTACVSSSESDVSALSP